ncbi:MAG: M48 family metallopeptidase, partial [Candidatus Omnitrophota bacterium]
KKADLVIVPSSTPAGETYKSALDFYNASGKPTVVLNVAGKQKGNTVFVSRGEKPSYPPKEILLSPREAILMVDTGKQENAPLTIEEVLSGEPKPEGEVIISDFSDMKVTRLREHELQIFLEELFQEYGYDFDANMALEMFFGEIFSNAEKAKALLSLTEKYGSLEEFRKRKDITPEEKNRIVKEFMERGYEFTRIVIRWEINDDHIKVAISNNSEPDEYHVLRIEESYAAPADMARLIDRGHYKDESLKQTMAISSSGIGISIAKKVIEGAGGSLSYEFKDGWTTFEMNVPKVKPPGTVGMVPKVWKKIVPYLKKLGFSDRTILALGGTEEIFFSGVLVSGIAALATFLGIPVFAGLLAGSVLSVLAFRSVHPEEDREDITDLGINIRFTYFAAYFAAILMLQPLTPLIPLLIAPLFAGLYHAYHNAVLAPRLGLAVGMVGKKKDEKTGMLLLRGDPSARHEAKKELNLLKADFGFLPQDHALNQYIKELLRELYPDVEEEDIPRIEVLASRGYGLNSLVMADGTIVFTPELFDFLQYKEELAYVILHEIAHLDKKHFQRIGDVAKRKNIRQAFGVSRYSEYEADMMAFLMLEEKGFNPYGAISFFQKLRESGLPWGKVHGTSTDRMLNIETLTVLKDFEGISYALSSIPDEIQRATRRVLKKKGGILHKFIEQESHNWDELPAKNANKYLIREVLPGVLKQIDSDHGFLEEGGEISQERLYSPVGIRFDNNKRFLNLSVKRLKDILDKEVASSYELKEKSLFYVTVLHLMGHVPFFEEKFDHIKVDNLDEVRADFLKEIRGSPGEVLEFIRDLFQGDVLSEVDLFVDGKRLAKFVLDLLAFAVGGEVAAFDDSENAPDYREYLETSWTLLNAADSFARRMGIRGFAKRQVWTRIVYCGLKQIYDLGQNEEEDEDDESMLLNYFKVVRSKGLSLDYPMLESMIGLDDETGIDLNEVRSAMKKAKLTVRIRKKGKKEMVLAQRIFKLFTESHPEDSERRLTEFQAKKLMNRYSLDEIAAALKALEEIYPDEDYAYRIFMNISDFLMCDLQNEKAFKAWKGLSLDECIMLCAHFERLFVKNQEEYEKVIDRIFIDCAFETSESNFDLPTFEKIGLAINDPEAAFRRFGFDPPEQSFSIKVENCIGFKVNLFRVLFERLSKARRADKFFKEIESFLRAWPLLNFDEVFAMKQEYVDIFKEGFLFEDVPSYFDRIVEKGIGFINKSRRVQKNDARRKKRFFLLSFFSRSVFVRNTLQEHLIVPMIKDLPFEEALSLMKLLFQKQKAMGFSQGLEYLIEEKAETPEQLERLEKELFALIGGGSDSYVFSKVGEAVVGEAMMERMFRSHTKLLTALLWTGEDDTALKTYLFELWYWYSRDSVQLEAPDTMLHWGDGSEAIEDWSREAPDMFAEALPGEKDFDYFSLPSIYDFFINMDYKGRYALLRKLLTDKGGVFTTRKGRNVLLDSFLDNNVAFGSEGKEVESAIEDVLREFIHAARDDDLYFALYPLLIGRIAKPPRTPTAWEDLNLVRKEIEKMLPGLRGGKETEEMLRDLGKREEIVEVTEEGTEFLGGGMERDWR